MSGEVLALEAKCIACLVRLGDLARADVALLVIHMIDRHGATIEGMRGDLCFVHRRQLDKARRESEKL